MLNTHPCPIRDLRRFGDCRTVTHAHPEGEVETTVFCIADPREGRIERCYVEVRREGAP